MGNTFTYFTYFTHKFKQFDQCRTKCNGTLRQFDKFIVFQN